MLWSDPPDEADEELRQVQAHLRRAGRLIALAAVVVIVLGLWGPGGLP